MLHYFKIMNFLCLCLMVTSNIGAASAENKNKILSIYSELTNSTHIIINTNFKPIYKVQTVPKENKFILVFPQADILPRSENIHKAGILRKINFIKDSSDTKVIFENISQPITKNFIVEQLADKLWQVSFDVDTTDKKTTYYKNISQNEFLQQILAKNTIKNQHVFTVVLDPGHGGIDSGAIAYDGTLEKNITLKFAKVLKHKLEQNPNIKVFLTREDDRYLYLDERIAKARKFGVNLFISIHADIINSPKIKGSTIYTLSKKSSDNIAKTLEYSQNKVDEIKGVKKSPISSVEDILIDLASDETQKYRRLIVQQLVNNIKKQKIFMINNPSRSANFKVLKALDFPSVLIELGYLSNKTDKKTISSPNWQAKMATAIAIAIENFRRISISG